MNKVYLFNLSSPPLFRVFAHVIACSCIYQTLGLLNAQEKQRVRRESQVSHFEVTSLG